MDKSEQEKEEEEKKIVPNIRLVPGLTLEDELWDKALTILEDAIKKILRSKS